jgi:hypothetical protein
MECPAGGVKHEFESVIRRARENLIISLQSGLLHKPDKMEGAAGISRLDADGRAAANLANVLTGTPEWQKLQ